MKHLFGKIVPRLMLVVAVTLPALALGAGASKNCQLTRYASLDLKRAGGLFLVPVIVQDAPGYMFLNTASGLSTVSDVLVDRLHLKTEQLPAGVDVTSHGKALKTVVTANGFSMGGAHFSKVKFLVRPAELVPRTFNADIFGTLGMDVFGRIDVELDLANSKMNLYSQDHCPGEVVYWSPTSAVVPFKYGDLREIYFPMEIEGKKLESTLSTGERFTALPTDVTKKLFDFDESSAGVNTIADSSRRIYFHYRAMKLSNEALSVLNADVYLIDQPDKPCRLFSPGGVAGYEGCSGMHPLQLGLNVLTKLHIYIATKEKTIYLTPANARSADTQVSEPATEAPPQAPVTQN